MQGKCNVCCNAGGIERTLVERELVFDEIKESLPALANTQLPRSAADPLGLPKRKSGRPDTVGSGPGGPEVAV